MHLKMRWQRKLNFKMSYPSFESVWITHICLMVRQCFFTYSVNISMANMLAEFFKRIACVYCLFSLHFTNIFMLMLSNILIIFKFLQLSSIISLMATFFFFNSRSSHRSCLHLSCLCFPVIQKYLSLLLLWPFFVFHEIGNERIKAICFRGCLIIWIHLIIFI